MASPASLPFCLKWAVPDDRRRLIFVYCSHPIPHWLLNHFFLVANHSPACGYDFRLCLVLSDESRRYDPRNPIIRQRGGIHFLYENDLPLSPASLFAVSIELDEQTALDKRSCLLRKNGWSNLDAYGEVRCEFTNVLDMALQLWGRQIPLSSMQSRAAIHGGILPAQDRRRTNGPRELPLPLVQRSMPRVWRKRDEGTARPCPVFITANIPAEIVDCFLDTVNLGPHDPNHRVRAQIVHIDLDADCEYTLVEEAPAPPVKETFKNFSVPALICFMDRRCTVSDLSTKHFIILDDLTTEQLPRMTGGAHDQLSPRRLNCMIGDVSNRRSGRPLLLRCSFDACADVLDDVTSIITDVDLGYYANCAAVEYGGCFCYKISRHTRRVFGNRLDPSNALDPANSRIVNDRISNELLQLLESSAACSQARPGHVQLEHMSDLGWALDSKPNVIGRANPNLAEGWQNTPEQDHYYDPVSQSYALGLSQTVPNAKPSSSGPVTLYEPRGSIVSQVAATKPSAGEGKSSRSEAKRVDSFMDFDASDSEDGYLRLPEVTGLTQMSCD